MQPTRAISQFAKSFGIKLTINAHHNISEKHCYSHVPYYLDQMKPDRDDDTPPSKPQVQLGDESEQNGVDVPVNPSTQEDNPSVPTREEPAGDIESPTGEENDPNSPPDNMRGPKKPSSKTNNKKPKSGSYYETFISAYRVIIILTFITLI